MILNLHLLAASLCISLNFISCFFGVLSLKMTKKQMYAGIVLTIGWGYILAILSWYMESDSVFLVSMIVEIGYMVIAILLFAKGNFWYNCFSVMVVSWILNFINLGIFSILDFQTVKNMYQTTGGYLKVEVWYMVLMGVSNVPFALPVGQLVKRFVKEDGSFEGFYRFFMLAFVVENVFQGIFQIKNAGKYEWFYEHHDTIYYLYAVVCLLLFYLAYLYTNKRNLRYQEDKMLSVLALAKQQYESSVEKNKEYHMLRHEWNRQVGLLMKKDGFVSQNTMQGMILNVRNDIKNAAMTPYSGNVYLDMVLEQHTRKFCESDKTLEIHIESREIHQDFAMEIAQLIDEMLSYATKYERICSWCMLGIHKKGEYWFCQLEYDHNIGKTYNLKKMMQLIGNNLIMHQRLSVGQAMVEKKDGAILYYLEKEKANLAIMIKE